MPTARVWLAVLCCAVWPGLAWPQVVDPIFADGFEPGACPVPTQSCYSGPAGTEGVGVCEAGSQCCIDGSCGACIGEVLPSAESCNALDDDCDGPVDEDFDVGSACTVGTGACQANGATVCSADGSATECDAVAGSPTPEVCDGIDNDCDTLVDEGFDLGSVCTVGTGACQATGVRVCSADGLATECSAVPGNPTPESCDGIDNDCDGFIDENCDCAHVAPFGNDITGTGSAAAPKRTIGAGISVAGTTGFTNVVCVAAGSACTTPFDYAEAVAMRNGIHVYGGYQATGSTWPRVAGCVTRIVDQDSRGVLFDPYVTATTILDGFTILGTNNPTNAAVTVQGSTGAVINNNVVIGGSGTTSYGVNVTDGFGIPATPTISDNGITGGNGTSLAVGVRSLNSAPVIQGNCSGFDASGRCSASCLTPPRFITGRPTGLTGFESYGVRLEASPGAVVDQNSICSNGSSTGYAAGVRLSGDATGVVVRANNVVGSGGQASTFGVWADPCEGASPWVVNNFQIAGSSTTSGAFGILAIGSCDLTIADNLLIVGRLDSSGGPPTTSTGIECRSGACALIQNNRLISGGGGSYVRGVVLASAGTLVDANVIHGGCATGVAGVGVGLLSNDSFARIQNNQISGATSEGACTPTAETSTAVEAVFGPSANEIDLNSNDLYGGGFAGACVSHGIAFRSAGGASAPRGFVRNNIVFAGACNNSSNVVEGDAFADPRVLQNNDLVPNAGATALYRNDGTNLTTIVQVNQLTVGPTASANISADPLYVGDHLSPSSPCRNAGSPTGAPNQDFEGDPRPQESVWDIGRDEYKP